ncbi:MAG TPA: xylan 1,4-beta-xylosidase [Actinomycetota bacterium]|nr:xylan 1,4-beta-xylosidase [Actinomycetota bacterium]
MAAARSFGLRLAALACAAAAGLPACSAAVSAPGAEPRSASPAPGPPAPTAAQQQAALCRSAGRGPGVAGSLVEGITHTQYSADNSGDTASVGRAAGVLSGDGNCLQNQHLMGWGAENPEPSPGVFNFATLDARMDVIRGSGGTPVLTLCCAPDWMKGGAAGTTDWTKLDVAPTPDHFADFAALARAVAKRYPDVLHYQVWSELKGFYNAKLNRWDYEGYTALYNMVYDTLKGVNPAIQVGGPYVVMDSEADATLMSNPSAVRGVWGTLDQRVVDVLGYWLANIHGADFLAVEAGTSSRDGTPATDEFTATQKLGDLTTWLRSRTNLPVWWSEWYVVPTTGSGWTDAHKAAVVADALARMVTAGTAAALLWQPQADATGCPFACLWTDTRVPHGGQPTVLASLWPVLGQWLAVPGHHAVGATPASVTAFETGRSLLVINTTDQPVTARVAGAVLPLGAYGVVVHDAAGPTS